MAERSEAGARAARVRKVIEIGRPIIEGFWNDLGHLASSMLGDVASAERASLQLMEAKASTVAQADDASRQVLTDVPDLITERVEL
ncbi:hypothetical protein, partial [Mesorhizobium sp.]